MADPHKTHHAIGMGATEGWCLAEAFLLFIQSLLVALIAPQDHGVEEAVIGWPDWIEPNRLVGQLQRLRNLTQLEQRHRKEQEGIGIARAKLDAAASDGNRLPKIAGVDQGLAQPLMGR